MKILTTIFSFFKGLDIKTKLLVIAALLIIALAGINKYNYNRYQKTVAKAEKLAVNLKAAQDTIRITKAKNGSIEYDKLSFIVDNLKELKKINSELAKEVEITKGKVAVIQKEGFRVVHDTIKVLMDKPKDIDGVLVFKGTYDKVYSPGNYRSLATLTTYSKKDSVAKQSITKDEIGFTATTGLKKTDGGYEIFVRPDYPNMKLVALQGAVIEKEMFMQPKSKPPLITFGMQVGYTPASYDLVDKNFYLHPTRIGIGAGFNINVTRLLKK